MKTYYLVYANVPSILFENAYKHIIGNSWEYEQMNVNGNSVYHGLYAWTSKKSLLNEFLKYRDPATYQIKECYDDEYIQTVLKEKYWNQKIDTYTLVALYGKGNFSNGYDILEAYRHNTKKSDDVKTFNVIMTKEEYVNCTEYREENWLDFGLHAEMRYDIFTDEFIQLLDEIGYTLIHDIYYTNNQQIRDCACYMLSFDVSPFGNEINLSLANEMSAFLLYYRPLIFGGHESMIIYSDNIY